MSIYLSLDAGEPHFLASNQGWGAVVTWADGLDAKTYPALVSLVEHGVSEDLDSVLSQGAKAVEESPPEKDVLTVMGELADTLKGRDGATVATINNGMGA